MSVLSDTLSALRQLIVDSDLVELIIVDNASQDKFDNHVDLNFPFTFKLVREANLGLTKARIKGIRESSGELLVFVDDDNVLDSNYLSAALNIYRSNYNIGCFGSCKILPIYEMEPHEDILKHTEYLALRDDDVGGISNDLADFFYPYGAGMIVRRDVAMAYVDDMLGSDLKQSLDRKGDLLNSCGDDHFSWIAIRMGYQKGIFPELKLKHHIPAFRVQKSYLLKLAESFGYSRSLLFYVNGHEFPGLKEIKFSEESANNVGSIRRALYRLKRWLILMGFAKKVEIDVEFRRARHAGVLRFYYQVYRKQSFV